MRKIGILAAASIMFIAALPLSTVANAATMKQCQAAYNQCMNPPPPPERHGEISERAPGKWS
jgi:hypothetical protein